MGSYAKASSTRTTIWREQNGDTAVVQTIPGLPFGSPKIGQLVHIPDYGKARCTGVQNSGSGKPAQVTEIRLTVK